MEGPENVNASTHSTPLDLSGKRVTVVGLARSGAAAARMLLQLGARVSVTEAADSPDLREAAADLRNQGAAVEVGGHGKQCFADAELIVLSPGVPHTLTPVSIARRAGIPVWGELELAARRVDRPMVAVSGTNGKTTVTSMIGKMLERSGKSVFVGGNIGNPLSEYVMSGKFVDVVVVEVSSFQLDTIETFRPTVGVLLNITADHLDRYDDFADYAASKARLFSGQRAEDTAVLNADDSAVRRLAGRIRATVRFYGRKASHGDESRPSADLDGRKISLQAPDGGWETYDLSQVGFAGEHNMENACAAVLAARCAGGIAEGIQEALVRFATPDHRMQLVAEIRGIRCYNDSKATNVDAVQRALDSFTAPLVLLMGGRDKGGDFHRLRNRVGMVVKRLILFGEAAGTLAAALGDMVESETVNTLAEAVHRAMATAEPGDVVLMSPGCASFDAFSSYAERGEAFCEELRRFQTSEGRADA
jgi:UDP-N-acetylmuramoylalanine--D-glutamate ligase